jgi:hypothetical protein
MNMTALVDVAIGLTVVYLGASLFVTVINEYAAQVLNLRGSYLCNSLMKLFTDQDIRRILTQSPALKPFFGSLARKTPSYVDPNVLGQLLIGGLAQGSTTRDTLKSVSKAIENLPSSELKTQLQSLLRTSGSSIDALVKAVSDWTDRSLSMLGEGYKRNLQIISLVVGFAVAIGFNLDTLALTGHLYRDKDARDATVALGIQIAEMTGKETFEKCIAMPPQERREDASCAPLTGLVDAVQGRNESLGKLPFGWPDGAHRPDSLPAVLYWAGKLLGWVLTALALSLGAPFWFDLLNKFVNIRHGMRKPEVAQ